jgi:DNA repair ATPase RecN
MMNKISQSSDKLENQDSGVTDSPWQPSWWQWLISALSGTVETEKQIAWLKMTREESNRREEDAKRQHEQRMKELREDSEKYSAIAQQTKKENEQIKSETEQLKKDNERLAELESKIEELFYKHGINSNPTKPTDKP